MKRAILSGGIMNKETKVLVSEIAKLYGLTNQTLHYYEGKKIIRPVRGFPNNYRYFNASDIKRLGAIKKYRNAEFTLEEALQMCEVDGFNEIVTKMKLKKTSILSDMTHKQRIADSLEEKIRHTERYQQIGNQPIIEILPKQYILAAYDFEVIHQNDAFKNEASSWFQNNFFTYACSLYESCDNTQLFKKIAFGMIATEDISDYLNLKMTENIICINEGLSVTSSVKIKDDQDIQCALAEVQVFIQRNNYKLRNKPFIKTIFASKG